MGRWVLGAVLSCCACRPPPPAPVSWQPVDGHAFAFDAPCVPRQVMVDLPTAPPPRPSPTRVLASMCEGEHRVLVTTLTFASAPVDDTGPDVELRLYVPWAIRLLAYGATDAAELQTQLTGDENVLELPQGRDYDFIVRRGVLGIKQGTSGRLRAAWRGPMIFMLAAIGSGPPRADQVIETMISSVRSEGYR